MIKYLKHDEIDTEQWDSCISNAVNGVIYANSWYLDLVNDQWEALVSENYDCVMPLTPGKKYGINYLFQPKFTQQLGVFSRSHLTEEVVLQFLDAIPKKYRFIEINLNTHNKVNSTSQHFFPWKNHELDLINTYDSIAEKYSKNLKRNLKKSEKATLSITENVKPENIIDIFRQNRGKDLGNLKDKDYDLLRRMIYVMIYKQRARVIGVYNEMNELCAGAFFVFSGNKAIFFFSATDAHAKKTGAMPYLINHFIRQHAGSHLTLDFEGSNDEMLARFYKSFGAIEIPYIHYNKTRLNVLFKGFLSLKKKIKG